MVVVVVVERRAWVSVLASLPVWVRVPELAQAQPQELVPGLEPGLLLEPGPGPGPEPGLGPVLEPEPGPGPGLEPEPVLEPEPGLEPEQTVQLRASVASRQPVFAG